MVENKQNASSLQERPVSPSIGIAFRVLDEIVRAPGEPSAAEINAGLDLPKSTLHRILNSLEVEGAVRRNNDSRRYSLGARLGKYAAPHRNSNLVANFLQLAGEFVATYNETIQLCTYLDGEVTFIAFVESTQPVRLRCWVGKQLPANATASGKVILANSPEHAVEEFASKVGAFDAMTSATITDPRDFVDRLEGVRRDGFATESQESARNLSCISAPVLARDGFAVAAVTLCIPATAITEEHLERLTAPLLQLSSELGAHLPTVD